MEFSGDVDVSTNQLPAVCTSVVKGPEAQANWTIPEVHKSSHSGHTKDITGLQFNCGDYTKTMCYFQKIKGCRSRRWKVYGIVWWFLLTIGYQMDLIIQLKS